jgi:carbamoyltransferase
MQVEDALANLGIDYRGKVFFSSHHLSHASSAFLASPFDSAAILTLDGVGEWATASLGVGHEGSVRLLREMRFPDSPGLLYSAFTHYCGFRVNSGEYKLMGLAPYGEPVYKDLILRELVDLREDGSFGLRMAYFGFPRGRSMINRRFEALFGGPARRPEGEITRRDCDIARSIQVVTEEIVLRMARHLHGLTGSENLCMAGGVALNCVANGRILREGPFKRVWVQPAAGDAGGALGAALALQHMHFGLSRFADGANDLMQGAALGPEYDDCQIGAALDAAAVPARRLDPAQVDMHVAEAVSQGRIVGYFQGRAEFGPRALGNRSILADARNPATQRVLNQRIKRRESFRPFAPIVLEEKAGEYFDLDRPSPYMLFTAPVVSARRLPTGEDGSILERLGRLRSDIPAVTHQDYSARVQTVCRGTHPRLHALLSRLHEQTGCAVMVNTSFNVRGEPPVCSPEDAISCFLRTGMDMLAIGSYLVDKETLPPMPQLRESIASTLD